MSWTLAQLQTEALLYSTDQSAATTARITRFLNEGMNIIARASTMPELIVNATLTSVAGTQTISSGITSDVIRFLQVSDVTDIDQTRVLRPMRPDELAALPSGARSRPEYFSWDIGTATGRTIALWPIPDRAYSLECVYYREPTDLASAGDTFPFDDVWARAVIHYAVSHLYLTEDDADMASVHQNVFKDLMMRAAIDRHKRFEGPRQVRGMWATNQPWS